MPAAASWDGEGVREAASGRDRAGQRDGEGATDRRIVGRGFSPRLLGASDGSWDAVSAQSCAFLFCLVRIFFNHTSARGREGRRTGRHHL
jgi:hypothetical protein